MVFFESSVDLTGAEVEVQFFGASVVNGHQVVYWVIMSLTVTVAVETKAGETVSKQIWSSQEVMMTKVVH